MRAYRMLGPGQAELMEVPRPNPGPGQVRLTVLAAGICHSDLHVLDAPDGGPAALWPMPFTLGHETCGRVAEVGPDVRGVSVGEHMVVHSPWGCERCPRCDAGRRNYCDAPDPGAAGVGLGRDGGLADDIVVDARRLVPSGDLDPAVAATLADAGLTSYHAVAASGHALTGPDPVAVVLGVGGLGHLAIDILARTTTARVVAVDVRAEARGLALSHGATVACGPEELPATLASTATTPSRADVVFDFVGSDATMRLAAEHLRRAGEFVLVGSAGGHLPLTKGAGLPQGAVVRMPFWGSQPELAEVVALSREHGIRPRTTAYSLDDTATAFDDLRGGHVLGRAVVIP